MPIKLADLLLSISENPLVVLLIVNVALLIFGCVMDTTAILLVPVLVLVLKTLGIDPVHFGIIQLFLFLIVVTYWPSLSLAFPDYVFGR